MQAGEPALTERQRQILRYIYEFGQEWGFPPSIREIGSAVGTPHPSVISHNLKRLEEAGLIEREPRRSRGIRLTRAGLAFLSIPTERTTPPEAPDGLVPIPLLGEIVAGEPIPIPPSDFSLMGADETIELARSIFRDTSNLYALRVRGNSMIDALIHDGDIVILRHTRRVENGEMAAVWLRDREETTLKRVYWEGKRVRLQPANPSMRPIYIDDPSQVEIQGKVVMVIRRLH
ncbi:MAG TPA: repressor LexA [Anaerolineales bacterium]|nr:repressor LexA [Anaerolineae bacterium]HIP86840.1 repressor LexA [Anaerolineales bacterium]